MVHAWMDYNLDLQKNFQQKKRKIQGKCTRKKEERVLDKKNIIQQPKKKKEEFRFSDPKIVRIQEKCNKSEKKKRKEKNKKRVESSK